MPALKYLKSTGGKIYYTSASKPVVLTIGSSITSNVNAGGISKSNGWYTWTNANEDLKYIYLENNTAVKGWKQISGSWYYFDSNGMMVVGWQELTWEGAKHWYYFEPTPGKTQGSMYANRNATIDGKSYHFNASGVCDSQGC
jgi:glucan-binding YG repeat protein